MRLSKLFTHSVKDAPADEVSLNAQLLIRAGYVYKVMAGVYAYTPLGLKVLENIKQIVREEMDAIGGQELIMSSLQKKETWEETGRWDDEVVDVWFKSKLKDGTEVGFGWSHEESIIEMTRQFLSSYKDMPIIVYQFQTKLRNELRAKSGIMRGREFVMKDMYSMNVDAEAHDKFYEDCISSYKRVFERVGIGSDTFVTFASGGAFTKFSHEFQTICSAGEDVIYLHREKGLAINEEVLSEEHLKELGIKKSELEKVKSAEVGNIFNFGTHKSQETNFVYTNSDGHKQLVYLGSYGIGITRLMGVIAEKFADDKGLSWPLSVAPAKIYIVRLGSEKDIVETADKLYGRLTEAGISVIYDDRDEVRAGEKFADADLYGIPYRAVVSPKTLSQEKFEFKSRSAEQSEMKTVDEIIGLFAS